MVGFGRHSTAVLKRLPPTGCFTAGRGEFCRPLELYQPGLVMMAHIPKIDNLLK